MPEDRSSPRDVPPVPPLSPVRPPAVRRWGHGADPRFAVRTAVVWETLQALVDECAADAGAAGRAAPDAGGLDVVDIGGGTGGFAVLLAGLGHRVTVVDPSPDALAALQRRAAEAGVAGRVRAEQGDAGTLVDVVGAGGADVVLCHGVLEYVDDARVAVQDALAVLRPGGLLSVLVAQRLGAVLAQALSGRFPAARRLLQASAAGHPAENAAAQPRRFDRGEILALVQGPRTRVRAVQGVRLVTDLLPGALVDGDPDAAAELLAFERAAGEHPDLLALAAQLHVAVRVREPGDPAGD